MVLIQESYVSVGTPAWAALDARGAFAKDSGDAHANSSWFGTNGQNHWWGVGGMLDFSNADTAAFWFDCKMCALLQGCDVDRAQCGAMLPPANASSSLNAGALAFWLDLGDPEMYASECSGDAHY